MIIWSSATSAGGNCEKKLGSGRMTPEIRKEVDLAMWVASQNPDAKRATQLMLDFWRIYPFVGLGDFEAALRRIDSTMYLIAIPIKFAPAGHTSGLPGNADQKPKGHFLWVEIHGKEQALKVMKQHGLTSEMENLDLLRDDTGVLLQKAN